MFISLKEKILLTPDFVYNNEKRKHSNKFILYSMDCNNS